MARIEQQGVPKPLEPFFDRAGVKIKHFRKTASFEKELVRFIGKNHVVHLATCKENTARSTAMEYRSVGFKLYILSAGGAKFSYLKANPEVSFSIAESHYDATIDYFGYKGVQGWGRAKVIRRKTQPARFEELAKVMKVSKVIKQFGIKELFPKFDYRIIEIVPDRIKYVNPREGVFRVTWHRRG